MRVTLAVRMLAAGLAALLCACAGPGYYAQAIGGHFSLMHARQDIGDYLREAPPDDPLAGRLTTAQDILAFADTKLELPVGDAYRQFVTLDREAAVWNVVAAPEFSLTPKRWCFLVAGCVPYRGYFDETGAQGAADRLGARGYDTRVAAATAYSTLGWFDDPLLDTMLVKSDAELAGTLFHELAHRRLYVPGDTAFNESYASFVEAMGVERWLRDNGRDELLPEWQNRQRVLKQWRALIADTRGELSALYATGLTETEMRARKAATLAGLRSRYDRLVADAWDGRDWFSTWFGRGPNNADFALVAQYHGGVCAFERLFAEAGGDVARFQALADRKARLDDAARAAWLERDCE